MHTSPGSLMREEIIEYEGADDDFDAALEKRRKHRREMKANTQITHNKLDRLVDVAARLEI